MILEKNKNLVLSFFERANSIRGTPVDMVTEDFMAHLSGMPALDLNAFEQYQSNFYASFSETETIVEDLVAQDDRVAFRGLVKTVHTADFMGVPSTGKQIVVSVYGFARLSSGKIAEWWNSPDRLS
jgi:predicted ester cyclase